MQLISPKPKISILSELETVIIRDLWEETTEEPHRRFWCLPPTQWLKQLSKNVNFLFSQRGVVLVPQTSQCPDPAIIYRYPGPESPHPSAELHQPQLKQKTMLVFSQRTASKGRSKPPHTDGKLLSGATGNPQLPSSCSFPTLSDQRCRMNLVSVYK